MSVRSPENSLQESRSRVVEQSAAGVGRIAFVRLGVSQVKAWFELWKIAFNRFSLTIPALCCRTAAAGLGVDANKLDTG